MAGSGSSATDRRSWPCPPLPCTALSTSGTRAMYRGRDPSLLDWTADLIGAGLSLLFVIWLVRGPAGDRGGESGESGV